MMSGYSYNVGSSRSKRRKFVPRRSHRFALLVLVVTFPLHGVAVTVGGFELSVNLLAALLVLPIVVLSVPLRRPTHSESAFLVFLAVATISHVLALLGGYGPPAVGSAASGFLGGWGRRIIHLGGFLFLFLLYRYSVSTFRQAPSLLRPVAVGFTVSATVAGLYGLYQVVGWFIGLPGLNINTVGQQIVAVSSRGMIGGVPFPRAQATFKEPGEFGMYLGFAIPAIVGFSKSKLLPYSLRNLTTPIVILLSLTLVLTLSRIAYIAFLVAMVSGVVFTLTNQFFIWKRLVAAGIILVCVGEAVAPGVIVQTLEAVYQNVTRIIVSGGTSDPTSAAYKRRLIDAMEILLQHPLFGLGLGGMVERGVENSLVGVTANTDPKSGLAFLLGNTGVAGTVALLTCLVTPTVRATKLYYRTRQRGFEASLLAYLTVGVICLIVNFILSGGHMSLFIWFGLALLCSLNCLSGGRTGRRRRLIK